MRNGSHLSHNCNRSNSIILPIGNSTIQSMEVEKMEVKKQKQTTEPKEENQEEKVRMAKCTYHQKFTPSHEGLPFFRARPESEFDEYYCGCYGWD